MKRILLLLSLVLASPALADDAVTSFSWNSVTSTFQAKLAALGWKTIPDYETGTFTVNFTGAKTISQGMNFVRSGKLVTISSVGQANQVSCATSTFNSGSTDVPAQIRPSASNGTVYGSIVVQSAGANATGVVDVTSGGLMNIQGANVSNFSGTCGWYAFAFTYSLQ